MKTWQYIVLAAAISLVAYLIVGHAEAERQWVRGSSDGAKYCYPVGHESKKIQRKAYFGSLEECQASIGIKLE